MTPTSPTTILSWANVRGRRYSNLLVLSGPSQPMSHRALAYQHATCQAKLSPLEKRLREAKARAQKAMQEREALRKMREQPFRFM
jgi:hypothetical protein